MPLRAEERIPMAIPVYLVSLKEPGTAEQVLTENVSSHGASVVTKQSWQPHEQQWTTTLVNKFLCPARVVYCLPRPNNSFCVGLEFREFPPSWLGKCVELCEARH
jgi:hypothetical protein